DRRVYHDAGDGGLDDGLHLGDGDRGEVGDVAGAGYDARRERQRRVCGTTRHLNRAAGALRVAGQGQHPAEHQGLAAVDGGVDDRGHLLRRRIDDVAEGGVEESDGLLGTAVDAERERLAVRQRERGRATGGRLGGGRVE